MPQEGVEVNPDAIINCEFKHVKNLAVLRVRDIQDQILSIIGFTGKEEPTEVGLEIIKSALIATMIGKFRRSVVINLDFDLDPRSFEFVSHLSSEVIGSLEDAHPPLVTARTLTELHPDAVISVPNQVMIGNSGGRDSFVSAKILEDCGFDLRKFKIDYDREDPIADYSTYENGANENGLDGSYEPFDIPMTYLAPLWNVRDRTPEHIAVGFSFDVLGFNSNQRRAPYESPTAIRLHQEYINALLGKSVRFIFPIATMSTYSVFEYIRRKFGLGALESRLSCWNSEKSSDCGHCDKCQRIKLASTAMHQTGYEYLRGMPQVIDNDSYLFGNPAYDDLVERYGGDSLAESQLFSEGLPFSDRIAEHLRRTFSRSYKIIDEQSQSDQPIHFNGDTQRMRERLEIDYDSLPTDRINDISTMMPYEQYFNRNVPVLAAHGKIPLYTNGLGWSYRRICDGPRLEVPDSLLFRRFFNNDKNE